eukprot:CAMPEP_0168315380 /NCGR_PEP_ID=MMETSP0210-20121227/11026_1 /TAXON_ID=40633 /ORGANISM="Condylostoma magnum, Strain COL2" /LENGTH=219 /DNA_ID=CAMNT_0008288165 /DNA_START=2378 /DNA_END=3037 /DNA_ORIENTATION=-
MVGQSERALATNKAMSAMKDHIQESDAELDVLRGMVANMQRSRPMYTPKRDDPIDIALADYVNSRGQVVPVPFTREDIGVYLFGTKRVFIKLENGKIIIRVGGGYMTIEEFVEVYTPLELDKLDSKTREDKHALRKAVLGKYADSLINTDNPTSRDMSPTRASKLIKDALYSGNTGYATCYAVPKRVPSPKRPGSPTKVSSPRRSPSRAKKRKSFGDYQ